VDWTGLDINTAARLTEDRHRWQHVLLTANPPGGRHYRRRRIIPWNYRRVLIFAHMEFPWKFRGYIYPQPRKEYVLVPDVELV